MKKMSTLALIALMPFFAITAVTADEETPATDAELASIVKLCNQDAQDDEVEAESLTEYLSLCINDELSANGFHQLAPTKITALIKK